MLWSYQCAVLLSLILCAPTFAQSKLEEKDKAVVAFDIQLNELLTSRTANALGIGALISDAKKDLEGIDPKNIVRVSGAIGVPENMKDAQKLSENPEQLPFNFFVRVQFANAESHQGALKILSSGDTPYEFNGKTYYRPPKNSNSPKNLIAHDAGSNILEIGTDGFILHGNRRETFTAALFSEFAKTSNDSIRIAMDVKGMNKLLAELIAVGKEKNPQIGMFGNVAMLIKSMRLSADLKDQTLLTLTVTSKGGDGTKRLNDGISALFSLAQLGSKEAVANLPEDVSKVATQLLNSLKTTQKGDEVTVAIPRPEGLEGALKTLIQTK